MCGCAGVRHSIGGADYGSVRAGAFMGLRIMNQLQADRGPEPLGQLMCFASPPVPLVRNPILFEQSGHVVFARVSGAACGTMQLSHSLGPSVVQVVHGCLNISPCLQGLCEHDWATHPVCTSVRISDREEVSRKGLLGPSKHSSAKGKTVGMRGYSMLCVCCREWLPVQREAKRVCTAL